MSDENENIEERHCFGCDGRHSCDGVALFTCPDCAFSFDAAHSLGKKSGVYSCPVCAEEIVSKERASLESQLSEVREERDALNKALYQNPDPEDSLHEHVDKMTPDAAYRLGFARGATDSPGERLESEAAALRKENEELKASLKWSVRIRQQIGDNLDRTDGAHEETKTRLGELRAQLSASQAREEKLREALAHAHDCEGDGHSSGLCDECKAGARAALASTKPTETPEHTNPGCRVLTQRVSDSYCLSCRRKQDAEPKPAETPKRCETCDGAGEIQEGTGNASDEGGEEWRVFPCPSCAPSGTERSGA